MIEQSYNFCYNCAFFFKKKNVKCWHLQINGKLKEKYPDFKHKETGKALWLTDSPAWVQPKLPSLKSKKWNGSP